jgi:hypothetical protein
MTGSVWIFIFLVVFLLVVTDSVSIDSGSFVQPLAQLVQVIFFFANYSNISLAYILRIQKKISKNLIFDGAE